MPEAKQKDDELANGRVVRVIGPVVDVEFPPSQLPEINTALTVDITIDQRTTTITCEVAQHIGDSQVRAIALKPTDGLIRGTPVINTGSPITVPVGEGRRFAMDRPPLRRVDVRDVGVQGLAEHVVDVAEHPLAHGHGDRRARVDHRGAPDQPVGRLEGDRPDLGVADVLRDLAGDRGGQLVDRDVDRQRGVDLGELVRWELYVHDRSDHPDHTAVRVFVVVLVRLRHASSFLGGGQRLGAADDLQDLRRDLVLTRPVRLPRQDLDQIVRVVGRGLHRATARSVL
jgi:hypothetical protein